MASVFALQSDDEVREHRILHDDMTIPTNDLQGGNRMQRDETVSTAEAEYVAACEVYKEALAMRNILK